jgi:hypothetical protein
MRAIRLYIGSAPNSVSRIRTNVAYRGQGAGGEKGDAGLIGEGGKVVNAGEAHDAPPRGGMHVLGVGSDGFAVTLEEPDFEAVADAARQRTKTITKLRLGVPGEKPLLRAARGRGVQ